MTTGLFSWQIHAKDIEFGDRVRPRGWYRSYETLGIEDLGDGYVKILWFVGDGRRGPEPWPPGPYSIFPADEIVERA